MSITFVQKSDLSKPRPKARTALVLAGGAISGGAFKVGGLLALSLLYAVFRVVLPGFEFGLELVLGGVAPRFFTGGEAVLLLVAGSGLGLFGAAAALLSESRP